MAFHQRHIDEIRTRISIVELIGETVSLKRSGKNFVGLCPFHSEKTPSFSVREVEGDFRCFGCGKRGSAFDFVMETRGLNFPEAVRFLARRAGIALPEEDERRSGPDNRAALLAAFREAGQIYQKILRDSPGGAAARAYLAERGVSSETVERFGIGLAPDEGQFLFSTLREGRSTNTQALLREVGLVRSGDRPYDAFRGRIVFPITRSDGAIIAFGGRVLGADVQPKYINSIESALYQKRRSFYGLAQGIESARKVRTVYLVEGYMDVVAMHQAGITNTFATCGTAVTVDHVHVLKRIADTVIVVFDGDSAGIRAAAGAFEVFLNSGIDVQAVLLPDGEDPSSLSQRAGALPALLGERAMPALELYVDRLWDEVGGHRPAVVGRVAERFAALVRRVNNPVERELLICRAAGKLGVDSAAFHELARSPRTERKSAPPALPADESALTPLMRQLVVAVICEPRLVSVVGGMSGGELREELPARIRHFLESISGAEIVGLENSGCSRSQWEEYLERFGLSGCGLVDEGIRQLSVGGSDVRKFVDALPSIVRREKLRRSVEELRRVEGGIDRDDSQLSEIAQQKLLKRRALERLRDTGVAGEPSTGRGSPRPRL